MHSNQSLKKLVTSFILSVLIGGILVGNAYIQTNIGYPTFLKPIGKFLIWVGLVIAIPPGFLFWILSKLGLAWELRGRETFIESNIPLWIYCVLFYTFFIYLIRFLWSYYKRKRKIE